MPIIRRRSSGPIAPQRTAPGGTVTGRLADALAARRGTATTRVAQRIERQQTEGEIATLPAEATPLTDLMRRASFESRPPRQTQYLHVSDLIGKCIRKFAVCEEFEITLPSQRLSLMDILTFGVGDKIHDIVKSKAAAGGPTQVWGNWRCKCGTTKTDKPCTFSELNPRQKCNACRGALTEYEEVPMRDEDLKIVGTPDLLFYLQEFNAFHIVELKSIAHAQWEELVRPKPEHVIQCLFYWFLMRRQGYRLTDKVSIGYITKGYTFREAPYKEFTFDPEPILSRLDPYLEQAAQLLAYRDGGDLPPRINCASENAPDAKKCEVCGPCFSGATAAKPVTVDLRKALARRR